jgi:Transposase DDE domain
MSRRKSNGGGSDAPTSFLDCLRHFLSPEVFRQAHRAAPPRKRSDTRWTLHPLLMVLILSCWAASDKPEERFESARAFYVSQIAPSRRRPGETFEGYLLALARLPGSVLRALAWALRGRLAVLFRPAWLVDGFIPLGCDGSRLACPRTAELERYLSQDGCSDTPPQVWVTAIVHLRLGLLWSWVVGKADANERQHLQRLLPTLPAGSLVVTDAGYQGYELASAMSAAGVSFLMRVSSQTLFYFAGEAADPSAWVDGVVYWWTAEARSRRLPPLRLRLLRTLSSTGKSEVWMVSNVLQPHRLSLATASRFYRMRWENEGFFRTYKRTLAKVKLTSRTVKLIHREAEGSLLAVQLLLAMGAWAVAVVGPSNKQQSSPSAVLREIRREMSGRPPRRRGRFLDRLRRATRDHKPRKGGKVRRPWPKRKDHKPPKPPKLRELNDKLKTLLRRHLQHEDDPEC